jgi:hypothetical protein
VSMATCRSRIVSGDMVMAVNGQDTRSLDFRATMEV